MAKANTTNPDPEVALALRRTLLAWTRTSLSMMGFGVVIARLSVLLREMTARGVSPPASDDTSRWIGVLFVGLGVFTEVAALVEYRIELRHLERGDPRPVAGWSAATVLAVLLIVTGVGLAFYMALEL
jgi:putative membrane protein